MYGQNTLRTSSDRKKTQLDFAESSSSVAKDLHKSRRELGTYRDSKRTAESAKAKAETELSSEKKKVKELTLLIEELNGKAELQRKDVEALKRSRMQKERALTGVRIDENVEYVEVMKELEALKLQLNRLKLDLASVLGEKFLVEKEIEDLGLQTDVNLRSLEGLKKEIDMANEEQVLVELARIEALKEYKEIEGERKKTRRELLVSLEERKKKIEEMMEEVEKSKEVENELSVTLSDVEMLQCQLKLVKEMEERVQRKDSLSRPKGSFEREKVNLSVLKEITEEIESKKKELASVRAEVFWFMKSMDTVRKEIIQVKEETVRFNRIVEKADLKFQRLNSKMLMTKSKLERVCAAEEGGKSLAANLTSSLEKLNCDKDSAEKEKMLVKEEIRVVKAEILKTERDIEKKERELVSKLNELERVKNSEALALAKLESQIENTVETQGTVSQESSKITISRFEYEYLTGRAFQAKEVADMKVEAAEAWVEALKASKRVIVMKTEGLKREAGVTRMEEEKAEFKLERSLSAKKTIERETLKREQKNAEDKGYHSGKLIRKSVKVSGKFTPVQLEKLRRYSSANGGSPAYFIIKKRKKVINLVKFFSRKRSLK